MSYSAAQLITRAFYLSGKISQDLETLDSSDLNSGLFLLNAVLAIKTANNRLIPYYTFYEFDTIVGQETYFIPNLISVDSLTFNINNVRFATSEQSRRQYFGSPRVDTVQSLPFTWHSERAKGGSNLYFYFIPDSEYPIKLWGKFSLTEIASYDTDLSTTMEPFYIEYLRYALAEYICAEYGITFQPQSQAKLDEYEKIITDISPPDLTQIRRTAFSKNNFMNWAYVNFPGWEP